MNTFSNAFSLGVGLLVLGAAPAFSCMGLIPPGMCTLKTAGKVAASLKDTKDRIRQLRAQVKRDQSLHINEVVEIAGRGYRTNIDFISDAKLRDAASASTPIAFARRLEALYSRLDDKEWREGVRLWGNYIARSEDLWEPKGYEKFCDLQDAKESLVIDAAYIVAWPFILGKGDQGALVLAPLSIGAGVVGLTADVATFIPSAAARAGEKLRSNMHVRLSANAFKSFAEYVQHLESAHG